MRASGNPSFSFHVEYCTPIQYCCHVFATVFRCRFHADRLDPETIRAAPLHGELIVHRRGMGSIAKLVARDGVTYVAPVLDRVRLVELDARGLLLPGVSATPDAATTRWAVLSSDVVVCADTAAAHEADTRADERRQAAEVGGLWSSLRAAGRLKSKDAFRRSCPVSVRVYSKCRGPPAVCGQVSAPWLKSVNTRMASAV